jgi:hypothetical protein
MKARILISAFTVFFLCLTYVIILWFYVHFTDDLPYRNIQSPHCFIYFDVEYKDKIYRVACESAKAASLLQKKSDLYGVFFSVFMFHVIRYELTIELDDELFNEIEYNLVDERLAPLYRKSNLKGNSKIDLNNPKSIPGGQSTAIYYLLKNNISPCMACESLLYYE